MDFEKWFDWLELKYLGGFSREEVESIRRFTELAWIASDLQTTKSWVCTTECILERYAPITAKSL